MHSPGGKGREGVLNASDSVSRLPRISHVVMAPHSFRDKMMSSSRSELSALSAARKKTEVDKVKLRKAWP